MNDLINILLPILSIAVAMLGVMLNALKRRLDSVTQTEHRTATIEQMLKNVNLVIDGKRKKIEDLQEKYIELALDIGKTLVLLKEMDRRTIDNINQHRSQVKDFDNREYSILLQLLTKYFDNQKNDK